MIVKGIALAAVTLLLQHPMFVASGGASASSTPAAYVNSTIQNQFTNPSNVVSYNCASGNLLVIGAGIINPSGTPTTSLSTDTGNTLTHVGAGVLASGTGTVFAEMWIVSSCNGTSGTYTYTPSSGAYGNVIIAEYSKGSLAGTIDNQTNCTGGSGGYSNSCSVSATNGGELMLIYIATNNGVTGFAGVTGFNQRVASQPDTLFDLLSSTSGSNTFPGSFGSVSNSTVTWAVTIK